jgi:hypothetical protein
MIEIENIQTALSELLAGTIGNTRVITAGTISAATEGALPGLTLSSTTADVIFGAITQNAQNPFQINGNFRIVDLPIDIELTKHLGSEIEFTARNTVRTDLIALADTVLQAISYPGNLRLTSVGDDTGIIGGALVRTQISAFAEDWQRHTISATVSGVAIVRVSQSGDTPLVSIIPIPNDLTTFCSGRPLADQLYKYKRVLAGTVVAYKDLPLTVVNCLTAPTGAYIIHLYRNSTDIGTFTFAPGSFTAVVNFPSTVTFATNDLIRVVGQHTQDATIADVEISMSLWLVSLTPPI